MTGVSAMTTAESGSPSNDPAPSMEPREVLEYHKKFSQKLLKLLEDTFFTTIKPILLIIQNTIVFGVFLLIDHLFFSLITLLSTKEIENYVVGQVFQDIDFITAIMIILAYVVRLCLELYHHREEYLGIPKKRRG